jgi:hypothetical protein
MDQLESSTQSFVVRIWLEETVDEAGTAAWRGHITHVPSGAQRYIRDLDDMAAFVAPYLQKMGVSVGVRWRLRQWLSRHWGSPRSQPGGRKEP